MRDLRECLEGQYKGFHNREHLEQCLKEFKWFHVKDDLYFVRDAWFPNQVIIFKVYFTYETNQFPQCPSNEIGNIAFYQEMTLDSFESAYHIINPKP